MHKRKNDTIVMMLVIAASLICHGCTSGLKEETQAKLMQLRGASELTTVEYTVTKIIKANDNKTWYKIGDRRILFTATAHLKAGIKLDDLDAEKASIEESAKSITLQLPHAQLLSLDIPPTGIRLAYQSVTLLRQNFTAEEQTELLRQGEADIRAQVAEMGILQQAERNARAFFTALLTQLGYEHITITFA